MAIAKVDPSIGQGVMIRCLSSGLVSAGTIQAASGSNLILDAERGFQTDAPIQVTVQMNRSLLCEVHSCVPDGDRYRLGATVRYTIAETAQAGSAW